MTTIVNLSEAKARLSAVVDDVRRTGRRYLIERHGKPAAAIVSVEEMERLESRDLGPHPLGALALIGAWDVVEDEVIDQFIEDVYRSRSEDLGRSVQLEP